MQDKSKNVIQNEKKVVAGGFFKIRDNVRSLSPFHRREGQPVESIRALWPQKLRTC